MTIKISKNKKIFDFAYSFKKIIKKERWVPRYDIESDSLSMTVSKLPNDARIKYFGNNEIAFYLTKNNDIKGIFIEYFKSNFIEHHKEFKGLIEDIKEKDKTEESLIELKRNKINKVVPEFEEIIQESLTENVKFESIINE